MKTNILTFLAAAFAVMLAGCGGGDTKTGGGGASTGGAKTGAAKTKKPGGGAAKEAFPKDKATASISGKVKFDGEAPKPKVIDMGADAECAKLHKDKPQTFEKFLVNEKKELQNTLLYVSKGVEKYQFEAPAEAKTIDQKGCRYEPHVFGIMTGQPLKILNSDPTTHNIHSVPNENKPFNESQRPGQSLGEKSFDTPEVCVFFKCDIHPWMAAWVGVFEHPFYAITGADGNFEIKGLPPGEYTVTAWHENFKDAPLSQTVTVKDNEAGKADFSFK